MSRGILGAGIPLAVCFPPWALSLAPLPAALLAPPEWPLGSGHCYGREAHSRLSGASGPVSPVDVLLWSPGLWKPPSSPSVPLLLPESGPLRPPSWDHSRPSVLFAPLFPQRQSPASRAPASPEALGSWVPPAPPAQAQPHRSQVCLPPPSYVPLTFSERCWISVIKQTSTQPLSAHTKKVTWCLRMFSKQ